MGINSMIEWTRDARPDAALMLEASHGRLREVLDVLDSIESGEMLAELPANPAGRRRHQCAVSMLAVVRRELAAVMEDLDVAQTAVEAISPPKPRG